MNCIADYIKHMDSNGLKQSSTFQFAETVADKESNNDKIYKGQSVNRLNPLTDRPDMHTIKGLPTYARG